MLIDVTSLEGPLPTPRTVLARATVLEALARFRDRIVRVRFEVPATRDRGPVRACRLYVLLDDGSTLECRSAGPNVADAMERAAHDMRRLVAVTLGIPLCERQSPELGDPRAERRAG